MVARYFAWAILSIPSLQQPCLSPATYETMGRTEYSESVIIMAQLEHNSSLSGATPGNGHHLHRGYAFRMRGRRRLLKRAYPFHSRHRTHRGHRPTETLMIAMVPMSAAVRCDNLRVTRLQFAQPALDIFAANVSDIEQRARLERLGLSSCRLTEHQETSMLEY
jgi:hypothetical protein